MSWNLRPVRIDQAAECRTRLQAAFDGAVALNPTCGYVALSQVSGAEIQLENVIQGVDHILEAFKMPVDVAVSGHVYEGPNSSASFVVINIQDVRS